MRIFAAMSGKQLSRLFSFTAAGSLVSLLVAACVVYIWYGQVSFDLTDASKALPGEATNYGFDVGKRISTYYKGCLLFGTVFLLFNSLLNLSLISLLQRPLARLLAWMGWIMAVISLLLALVSEFNWDSSTVSSASLGLLLVAICIVCGLLCLSFYKSLRKPYLAVILWVASTLLTTMAAVWVAPSISWSPIATTACLLAGVLVATLFANRAWWNHPWALKMKLSLLTGGNALLCYHALIHWMLGLQVPAYSYLLVALVVIPGQLWVYKSVKYRWFWWQKSFFLYPLLALLSYELALILNQRGAQFNLTALLFLASALVCSLLYARNRKNAITSISASLNRFFFPVWLLSFFAFSVYSPVFTDYMEMFEMANPAHSVMRVFAFDEWPFIDFISSHLLYEQLPQYLYALLNGYDGSLAFMTYGFYYLPLSGFLYYLFYKKVLQSGAWSFAMVLLVPFVPILLPTSFVLTLITLFLLYRLLLNTTVKNGSLLLFWTFFLVFWRVDIAAGTLPALAVIGLLHLLRQNFSASVLKAWLIPGLSIVALVAVVFGIWVLTSEDIHSGALRKLYSALWYFGGAQAHAVVRIAPDYHSLIFIVHHFVFPCLVVAILLYTAFKWMKTREKHQLFTATAILVLGLFYLFNAQRGLVRHGFIEGSDKHLSSFIYVLVPLFLLLWRKWNYPVLVFILSSSLLVVLGKHGSLDGYTSNLLALQTLPEKQTTLDFSQKIERCQRADDLKKPVDKVVEFLNDNLDEGQTFLDFSNTPMLYFYSQRAVPSYFNQSLQNIVTRGIQLHNRLDREDGAYDIPLVVFSHYPDNWWDNTDGVPNSVRYQNICKEIYQDYAPYQIVGKHQIWKRKDLLPEGFEADSNFFYPRQFKLHQYPGYFQMPEDNQAPLWEYDAFAQHKNGYTLQAYGFSPDLGQYLEVTFKDTELPEKFQVNYHKKGEALGSYVFLTKKGTHHYTIPLWSQYNWHLLQPDVLYLQPVSSENTTEETLEKWRASDWYEKVVLSQYPIELEH